MSSDRFDVIALGLNAVDYLIEVPDFPIEDSKAPFLSCHRLPGGQAATAAVTCARLGLTAAYLGAVGDDDHGRFARAELRRERIVLSHLKLRPGNVSQFAFILVNRRNGSRTIRWTKGPGIVVRPDELDYRWLKRARLFHCDGHNPAAELAAARFCREHGIPTVIDTESGERGPLAELLHYIDHIVVPASFPDFLAGKRFRSDRERLRFLRGFGATRAVLTRGSAGCVGLDGDGLVTVPAYRVRTVDTTGAGDVFHGAYLAGLRFGLDFAATLRFAAFVAGIKCAAFGARAGIPTRAELRTRHRRELIRWLGPAPARLLLAPGRN